MPPKRSMERGKPSSAHDARVQTRRQVETSVAAARINQAQARAQAQAQAQAKAKAPAFSPEEQIGVW
jgi:hypothetical protein